MIVGVGAVWVKRAGSFVGSLCQGELALTGAAAALYVGLLRASPDPVLTEMKKLKLTLVVFLVGAVVLLAACGDEGQDLQPLDILRFPTDMVLGGADGDVLYVVGANFDRRYAGGALHAIDLVALNEAVDAEPLGGVLELGSIPWLGGVSIGSFGGRIAKARLDGDMERLFVPLRGEGAVAVIDGDGLGELRCYPDGGLDCRPQAVVLPVSDDANIADPFAAAVSGGHVYVGALRIQRAGEGSEAPLNSAWLARVRVNEPEDVLLRPVGSMVTRDLVLGPSGARLYAIGSRTEPLAGEIRSFAAESFAAERIPTEAKSLLGSAGSTDGRSLVFSREGSVAYALTRSPSALVELDVGLLGAATLSVRGMIPLPEAPSRMVLLEEDGERLAVVTATEADALVLVDLNRRKVVGVLDGTVCGNLQTPCPEGGRTAGSRDPSTDVGIQPWAVLTVPRDGGGARVWVASFADGALRAVDIPDLRAAGQARVRAVVRTAKENGS